MADNLDDHSPEEIATGTTEFTQYLEEADSQVVDYTWTALMNGSVLLYDFREATG
jgi:hypothetical protein